MKITKLIIASIGIISMVLFGVFFTLFQKGNKLDIEHKDKFPNDYLFMQRAYPTGKIKPEALVNALEWKASNRDKGQNNSIWEFIGPTNVGGRITDIEIPSDDVATYYVGAASGGIFKTTDAGTNWAPIFDEQFMLSIGDIEISKSDNDLIYVGTGEVNAGGGSLAYDGNGIFRSNDAGLTWNSKGLEEVGSISKVLINPLDNNTLFAGAMGPLFKKDNNRGVYRSYNGGDSWTKVLFVSDSTGVIDMAINPIDPNLVYAASWERIRRPNYRSYGGETSRLYRSQDAGDTWDELTNGLPTIASQKGRISIDISASNPNVLYAAYTDQVGYIQGVFKTIDGGDSWIAVNSSQLYDTSYHWWFGGIYIDPTNPLNILHAGFHMGKSTDGGNSWSTITSGVHVDQHAIAYNTQIANEVLLGNDGGLYRSVNSGSSYTKINNLPITQFYRFTVDEQNDSKRYGGSQDNSTIRTTTGSNNDWQTIYGGDGFQPLVDPTNTNTIYALYQNGNLGRSLNNGSSFSTILNGISSSDRNNWDTPICFDTSDPSILYYGTHRVYKTENRGDNWYSISADLTNGAPSGNLSFGTTTSIDVSPLNSNIYAGTDDGNIWTTNDGGASWTKISDDLPMFWVTKVKASPLVAGGVYATFSGYRYGHNGGHVFYSDNNGDTWTDISTSIPDVPVNDIEIDSFGNLFLATDIGVLASADNGVTWEVFGVNFPSVVVTDLYYHQTSKNLYAGTYGRSSYRIDLSTNVLNIGEENKQFDYKIFPNPASDHILISFSNNTDSEPTMNIYNSQGRMIKSYSDTNFEKPQNTINLDVSDLMSGIYYLKIEKLGLTQTHKLIIKN